MLVAESLKMISNKTFPFPNHKFKDVKNKKMMKNLTKLFALSIVMLGFSLSSFS